MTRDKSINPISAINKKPLQCTPFLNAKEKSGESAYMKIMLGALN